MENGILNLHDLQQTAIAMIVGTQGVDWPRPVGHGMMLSTWPIGHYLVQMGRSSIGSGLRSRKVRVLPALKLNPRSLNNQNVFSPLHFVSVPWLQHGIHCSPFLCEYKLIK